LAQEEEKEGEGEGMEFTGTGIPTGVLENIVINNNNKG